MTTKDEHEALVQAATRGDAPAVDELLVRYLPGLEAFVRRHADALVLRKEEVTDVVQSICREALEELAGGAFAYQGRGQFVCWLHRVALSKLTSRRRYYLAKKRDAAREMGDPDETPTLGVLCASFTTPSQILRQQEEHGALAEAFDKLPADYQQVVFLAKVLELPHGAIAVELQKSENACRQLLKRAMARLAVLMGVEAQRRDREDAPDQRT